MPVGVDKSWQQCATLQVNMMRFFACGLVDGLCISDRNNLAIVDGNRVNCFRRFARHRNDGTALINGDLSRLGCDEQHGRNQKREAPHATAPAKAAFRPRGSPSGQT